MTYMEYPVCCKREIVSGQVWGNAMALAAPSVQPEPAGWCAAGAALWSGCRLPVTPGRCERCVSVHHTVCEPSKGRLQRPQVPEHGTSPYNVRN